MQTKPDFLLLPINVTRKWEMKTIEFTNQKIQGNYPIFHPVYPQRYLNLKITQTCIRCNKQQYRSARKRKLIAYQCSNMYNKRYSLLWHLVCIAREKRKGEGKGIEGGALFSLQVFWILVLWCLLKRDEKRSLPLPL